MNTERILDDIVASLENMPEVPVAALQVSGMLDDPDTDAQDLAKVIMMDPSLTAQILKICNSAEYGFSRKIATISEAVSILGYAVLKRVIYTIISHGYLNRPVVGYALDKGDLWENAVTCGAYARFIATKVQFKDPELAFIGALLRDIGKIALEGYLVGRENDLEEATRSDKSSFAQAEEKVLGVSHTTVGAKLAAHWKLPESLAKVIVYHHEPSALPENTTPDDRKLVSIVHLADCFTMMTGTGVGIDGLMYPLDNTAIEALGIPQNAMTLESWYAELLDLREQIMTMATTLLAS